MELHKYNEKVEEQYWNNNENLDKIIKHFEELDTATKKLVRQRIGLENTKEMHKKLR